MFVKLSSTGWILRNNSVQARNFSVSECFLRDKSAIYNTTKRPDPILNDKFRNKIHEGYKHPKSSPIYEPSEELTKKVKKVFEDTLVSERIQQYVASGFKLDKFIKHRKVPLEKSEVRARKKKIEDMVKAEFSIEHIDREEKPDRIIMKKLKNLENSFLHTWTPIEFDQVGALTYLVGRTAAEFASLKCVFTQIQEKDPNFQPRTFFDFGSGVASGLWAVKDTFGRLNEAFLVDHSKHMNDLARMILADGGDDLQIPAGISFRLQTPSSVNLKYDLVLCSNTLLELPTAEDRLSSLNSLWGRVEDDGYLVLIESGTNAGFHVVAEARDFLNKLSQQSEDEDGLHVGHVVAPCPHDAACPRHSQDTIPCNFPVRYRNFDIPDMDRDTVRTELISYVVYKKSSREGASLPRLVENPLRAKGNLYCRMCTSMGTLQEVLVRKKDDGDLFQLGKRMKWGDELPVSLKEWVDKPKIGTPWLTNKIVKNND